MSTTPSSTSTQVAESPAAKASLDLAQKSGCLACHNIDVKVVGPPWRLVANRYRNDHNAEERLFNKIKNGGKGNWLEVTGGVPMPAYSPRVSDENIHRLVDFVLSLAENSDAEDTTQSDDGQTGQP